MEGAKQHNQKRYWGNQIIDDHFNKNNQSLITDTKETANKFNEHFVNVGYNLAKEIVDQVITQDINENIIKINSNIIFLRRIEDQS